MKKLPWILVLGLITGAHAAVPGNNTNYGYVDLLVWQAREGVADNWAQVISPPARLQTAQLIDAPFNWHSGVRLGMGHLFDCNNDIALVLTHYDTTATNEASGIVYSAFDANYFANNTNGANFGPSYSHANIHWQVVYNTADINLGHYFRPDSFLDLYAYIGLKGASINQTIKTNWFNPTTTTDFTVAAENLKNDFWGIGPSIGADTTWPIYRCNRQSFNFIGNIATSLLWGHWHFGDVYTNNKPVTITTHVNSVNGLSPMLGGLLGIQWNMHFTEADFSIRLGYEEQVWFNQIQFYALDTGRANRSLSLQGGNLQFKLVC